MPQTTDVLAEVVTSPDYATPHAADITGAVHPLPLLVDDTWIVPVGPAGNLWSSAREMARYVQTELGYGLAPDGERVVSAENLERTWQPGVPTPAPPGTLPLLSAFGQHYALGWAVGTYGGQRVIWHAGGTFGFNALVSFLPEAELGVAVLTNAAPGTAGPVTLAATLRLLELVFDQLAMFDTEFAPGLAAVAQGRADLLSHLGEVDPATVTPYLGRYANPDLGTVTLALQAGKLVLDAGAFHAELRPRLGADGAVVAYLPVDAPLAGFPPQMTVTLEQDATRGPRVMLMIPADLGEADLVYVYEPVAAATTPAP
jgi:CubicO group peptidase (beta-lactamase class C family)